jgi:hypothetical protein
MYTIFIYASYNCSQNNKTLVYSTVNIQGYFQLHFLLFFNYTMSYILDNYSCSLVFIFVKKLGYIYVTINELNMKFFIVSVMFPSNMKFNVEPNILKIILKI